MLLIYGLLIFDVSWNGSMFRLNCGGFTLNQLRFNVNYK